MRRSFLFLSIHLAANLLLVTLSAEAQQLPSSRYDDYDRERQEQILSEIDVVWRRVDLELRNAESHFAAADENEKDARRSLEREERELRERRSRLDEVEGRLRGNQELQQKLKAELPRLQNEVQSLQKQVTEARESVQRLKSLADAARSESDRLKAELAPLLEEQKNKEQNLASKQKDFDAAQSQLQNLQNELRSLKEQLGGDPDNQDLRQKVQAKQQQVEEATTSQKNAADALVVAKAEALSAKSKADTKKSDTNQAEQRNNAAQTELKNAEGRAEAAQKSLQDKKSQADNTQAQLQKLVQNEAEVRQILDRTRDGLRDQRHLVERLERDYSVARNRFEARRNEREAAIQSYRRVEADRNGVLNELQRVDSMISEARRSIEAWASSEGQNDGAQEGTELGTFEGRRDGSTLGQQQGQAEGTRDARDRDYKAGYETGKAQGNKSATDRAEAVSEERGRADGEAQGKTAGLKVAYDTGKKNGLKHGAETGSDQVSYKKGRTKGEADGLAAAKEDARPQEPVGYRDQENLHLNAPLKSVTIGDAQPLARNFEGVQQRTREDIPSRYNPRPANYPHPRLKEFYMGAYDSSYRSSLDSTYTSVYEEQKEEARRREFRTAYAHFFDRDYADSRESGRTDAFKRFDKEIYEKIYPGLYESKRQKYYAIKFDDYKVDVAETKRGFDDGNAIASEEKGYKEGRAAAYAANIEIEKKRAYDAGTARANDLYLKNPVLKFESASILDSDRDGIFRPGEAVDMVVKLKNFGHVNKTGLVGETKVAGGQGQTNFSLSEIPAQSDATMNLKARVSTEASAKDGASLSLTLNVKDGAKLAYTQSFTATVQYPVQMTLVDFDGVLVPGEKTNLKLSFKNRSKSAQKLKIDLSFDASRVGVAQPSQELQLAAGETKSLAFIAVGKIEARFEETELGLAVTQGKIAFAMSKKIMATIIRRHSPTPDSKGLIISGNLAVGGGKGLYALAKMDTWDLRVDGANIAGATLAPYTNRALHLIADPGVDLTQTTLEQVKSFVLNSNGSLVIWGSNLDQSSIVSQLSQITGIAVARAVNITTTVVGAGIYKKTTFDMSGMAGMLSAKDIRAKRALTSGAGVHAMSSFGNGMSSKVGRVLVIGIEPSQMSAVAVQSLIAQLEMASLSFDEKLSRAGQSPSTMMPLVVAEIIDQMAAAEGVSGPYFSNSKGGSKLSRAFKVFVKDTSKGSAQSLAYAAGYPELLTASQQLREEKWGVEQILNERTGFLGSTLKEVFCRNNGGHALCK